MSLFKAREWWSTSCGTGEEFDLGLLAVGNADDAEDGSHKIVVASFAGVLRVYHPTKREYGVSDLILESDLGSPVLQLALGDFGVNDSVGEARASVVVLFSKSIAVFSVNVVGGSTNEANGASYHTLQKEHEMQFTSPSANFAVGPFIGKPYDGICVQSMDGEWTVFDGNTVSFSVTLGHDFLLPGPIAYCPRMDAFVTATSRFEVEKYGLRTLAASAKGNTAAGDKKPVKPDWKVCVGEGITQITSATGFVEPGTRKTPKNGQQARVDLIALGERSLFVINEFGEMTLQKRLDYVPLCMHAFRVNPTLGLGGEQSPTHLIITDHTGSGMVYKGSRTIWAAKFEQTPCALVAGAMFGGVGGMLVTLSEGGALSVGYLGAEAPVAIVRGFETAKDLGYVEMEKERVKLAAVIASATTGTFAEPTDAVSLRIEVPDSLDPTHSSAQRADDNPAETEKTLTVTIHVTYAGTGSVENVCLSVHAPAPTECRQESFVVPFVHGGVDTPTSVPVVIRVPRTTGAGGIPENNVLRVVAGYRVKGTGEARVATRDARLPLSLFVALAPPVKNSAYKVTLDTNRPPPAAITSLFNDIPGVSAQMTTAVETSGNVISFVFGDGSDVTIIVSKNAGRYRVQAVRFEALWLVIDELTRRLREYYAREGSETSEDESNEPFAVSFNEALPLQDFFVVVDLYHACRSARNESLAKLQCKARQFRAVQKRLLVRFRDKNPTDLTHLDKLLRGAFADVTGESVLTEGFELELAASAVALAAATRTVLCLISRKFGMNEDEEKVLTAYLSPIVNDTPEQGWAECTEASVTFLLKTKLAKGGDRGGGGVPSGFGSGQPLPMLSDTSKLKKHVSAVCERLARGAKLISS